MSVKLCLLALALAVVQISPAPAQDRIADLRSRLAHEPNPVAKAKLMPQLGDAEFGVIDDNIVQDKIPAALEVLKAYRDEVTSCDKALDAAGIDAEKHPGGFKQLQFSLRESLRRLDAILTSLTGDDQPPFLDIRKELAEMNRHLIEQLFPREQTDGSQRK